MYLRIVRAKPWPGQVDEVARRWKAYLAPRLGRIPGFRHAYFSADQEANRITAVSVWDDKPGEAADQAVRQFRQRVQDITVGSPQIEENEILAKA